MSKDRVRWYLIGIIALFSVGLLVVSLQAMAADARNTRDQTENAERIRANTVRIERSFVTQCENRNQAAQSSNAILDSLIKAVTATDSIPPDEKAQRLALYGSVKVPIINCKL